MSYTTPQLDAAGAVADLLTSRTVAGFTLVASADDQLPKYDHAAGEYQTLRVDCLVASPWSMTRLDRASAEEDCNVSVLIQYACDAGDRTRLRQLMQLTRDIARLLMFTPLDGFGTPREDVEVTEFDDAMLEGLGVFSADVRAIYRVVTEAPA